VTARVYVGGTFDLFHAGHVELLRRAARFGEVWVALNSDKYCQELKGKTPIMTYNERATVLLACEYVNTVLCNDGDEPELLELVSPRTIFYGNDGNWTRATYLALFAIDEEYLDRAGMELIFPERTKGVSSTDIVQRILGRHRADGGEAREHVPADAPCTCRRDEEAGRVPDDLRDGSGCPCR
jgi:glycerol-3-phosphate cytidylyltransferase